MKSHRLHLGQRFSIFLSENDQEPQVILKTAPITSLSQVDQLKFNNETTFINENIEGFRKVIDVINTTSEFKLKLQYIPGLSLHDFISTVETLSDKLNWCIRIAERLAKLHSQQIIHLNLNPKHILIENETGNIYFISLGLARRVQSKIVAQNKFLYSLADPDYIAPEQTGRISTDAGYSSDIYSLGVIFYKFFTGHLPFENKEGPAKIHAQIALVPIAPDKLTKIPESLSGLIMKMLEKDTEKRYLSAEGIVHDLIAITRQLVQKEPASKMVLGQNDYSGTLRFTSQLYGREKEIHKLLSVFKNVLGGEKQFLLVYGHSGVGKSSLVDQLYRPVFNEGGVFISGKFDTLKSDVPYFAFSQAFGKLMEHIEISNPEKVQLWQDELHKKLHPIGRVLFDLVPGLDSWLKNQPELPVLNGLEAQSRFNYAISNLLQVASHLCKPLVIFLDDLQWSDTSSLSLIKNILTNEEIKNILIIGAYRDNEINKSHIFHQFKMDIQESGINPEAIFLENLNYPDIQNLVEYTIGHSESSLDDLSTLVFKKSGGNAFFANQFIKSIYNNGILFFDPAQRIWKWEREKILEFNMEGDIVDLLLETINKLQNETKDVLKLASCIGNKFNLDILSKVTGTSMEAVYQHLKPAINIGLVLEGRDNNFYFVHDRIQQALYSLTDDALKGQFHLKIGRLILENTPASALRDSIFDIVNQFNFARELITEPAELKSVSELNLIAGNRSQQATAYVVALQYYEQAIQLLPTEAWQNDFRFCYNLFFQAAGAANQCNNPERFSELIAVLEIKAIETIDILKLADLKIQRATASNNAAQVIDIGLQTLRRVQVYIKPKPAQLDVLIGYIKTNVRLKNYSDEQIINLPKLQDEELIITMAIMHHVSLSAYFILPNMVPLIMFELIRLTLKHGLGPKSPFAFVVFGYINIAYMNKIEKGIKMGQLGYELSALLKNEDQICSLKQVYNTFISHWLMHLSKVLPDLEDGLKRGLETGDFAFTSITGQLLMYWNFYGGENIEKVIKRGELISMQVASLNQVMQIERIKMFRQSVVALVEGVPDFDILKGDIYDETKVDFPNEPAFDLYFHNVNMQKKYLAMVFNEYETAWKYCCKEKQFMIPVKGSPTELLFYYYESLCITPIFASRKSPEQKELLKICKKNLNLIRGLLKYSEINYKHRYELMNAEWYRLNGQDELALRTYANAIRYARLNKFILDEALAWERTGMFYLTLNQLEVAQFYLSNAYKTYKKWGAVAKLAHMRIQYKEYISSEEIGSDTSTLDLNTILKTIQLLSGEMVLENLLTGLMNLVAETAGAERAFLIIEEKDTRIIKASVDKSLNNIEVLLDLPYKDYADLSHSVVNQVARTGDTLVLQDATEMMPYANEDYILRNQVKSIVCHPLKHAGNAFAYLYLENKLVPGAFTKERVEIIQVIAVQTAISLQNTMLFEQTTQLNKELTQEIDVRRQVEENLRINEKRLEEYNANLENKVEERTRDLQIEKAKSDELLLNILPYDIAMELKEKGKAEAKTFESVSVLFTDFKEFSRIAEDMSAAELVSEIDYCFKEFDRIVQKYRIEKIKTIGDSYMAVGGLPVINHTHPLEIVEAALEIRDFIEQYKSQRIAVQKPYFEIRLGIHTGQVVAGIVGSKKFAYDIWGDTVNLASRMESNSEPGKINISSTTYELVKDRFSCSYRGKINVKNKGGVDMYFVEG